MGSESCLPTPRLRLTRLQRLYALSASRHPHALFGGVAIAYFFHAALKRLPPDAVDPRYQLPLFMVAVLALTSSATVGWEFSEFISDRYFGTHAQAGLEDTLLDMALGIAGALAFVVLAVRPLVVTAPHSRDVP